MADPGEGPPPPNESPPLSEDDSWWDALTASGLGDIMLGVAICVAGGALILAIRTIPMLLLAVGVGSVLVAVFLAGRHAARAGRGWKPSQHMLFAAIAGGGLVLGGGILYLLWVMLCDC